LVLDGKAQPGPCIRPTAL